MPDTPQGQRYSQTHLPRSTPVSDSPRARVRLAKLFEHSYWDDRIVEALACEMGVEIRCDEEPSPNFPSVKSLNSCSYDWADFFRNCALSEFLDAITVAVAAVRDGSGPDAENPKEAKFVSDVIKIFVEENLAYRIDDAGGVHPLVDAEFDDLTASTLRGLEGARYDLTRHYVEKIDPCLVRGEFTEAIRAVFDACENLFKLMYDVQILKAVKVKEKLGPLHQRLCAGNSPEQRAGAKMVGALGAWVDAAHNYRHASGAESPTQPDKDFAILMVSQGLAHLRWLAALNREKNGTRA